MDFMKISDKALCGKKRGFTLAEALIAFLIIGALIGLLLRVMPRTLPNKDKVLYLKAFRNLETALGDIINDPGKYNQNFLATTNADLSQDSLIQGKLVSINGYSYKIDRNDTLCVLLAERLNTIPYPDKAICGQNAGGNGWNAKNSQGFRTTDGIDWKHLNCQIEVPFRAVIWVRGHKDKVNNCTCSANNFNTAKNLSTDCRMKCGEYRMCISKHGKVSPPINDTDDPCEGAQADTLTLEQQFLASQTDARNR